MSASDTRQADRRPDDLFGVCAAIGEDFGFDPLWLRVVLSAGILWNPLAVFAAYAALGLAVLATRLVFPTRRRVAVAAARRPARAVTANDDAAVARAA